MSTLKKKFNTIQMKIQKFDCVQFITVLYYFIFQTEHTGNICTVTGDMCTVVQFTHGIVKHACIVTVALHLYHAVSLNISVTYPNNYYLKRLPQQSKQDSTTLLLKLYRKYHYYVFLCNPEESNETIINFANFQISSVL